MTQSESTGIAVHGAMTLFRHLIPYIPIEKQKPALSLFAFNKFRFSFFRLLFLLLAGPSTNAMAELSFNGESRFIMADARLTMTLANEDKETALAQVTLDWGDGDGARDLPMALSTPLVRIPARQKATVDVLYEGHGLPEDRESYFLLNVLEIPKAPKAPNVLQIALRHRFKLFYRPALQMTPDQARAAMTWERQEGSEGHTRISNPSPYYLTLSDIQARDPDGRNCEKPIEHLMLSPFSSHVLDMPTCRLGGFHYQVISDGGNPHPYHVGLVPGRKSQGSPRS